MKKLIQSLLPTLIISSQVFAIAGFGAYGDFDLLKYPEGISGDKATSAIEYDGFSNAYGGGIFFYVDVIPVIDLEVDLESVGNLYKFTPYIINSAKTKGDFPWGRISAYFTIRKEIIGLSIPLLAETQLYGGLGFNKHWVSPVMTTDLFNDAFDGDLNTALEKDFSDAEIIADLSKAMLEKVDDPFGGHLQLGIRGKLLLFNVFVNARYTIAKDVIPDKSGFPSLWMGLALGI